MFSSSLRSCALISSSLKARCWTGMQSPLVVKLFSVSIPTEDAIELLPTPNTGQKAVSKKFLPVGATINVFSEPVESSPNMHTIYFKEKTHIAPTDGAEFVQHGCRNTNIKMVVDETSECGLCVTTTEVEKGKDLTFNYNTTEWDMQSPFSCACEFCKIRSYPQYISGFKNLSVEKRNEILSDVNPLIRANGTREILEHLLHFQEGSIENEANNIHIPTEDAIELVPTSNVGSKAVAKMDLPSGAIINVFSGPVMSSPTMHTVQLKETIHIAPTDGAEFVQHGCRNTNIKMVVDEASECGSCIVTTDVKKGEDLTWNYNTTEWHMQSPFTCACESCKNQTYPRYINGFKNLSLKERNKILRNVTSFIRTKSVKESLEHFQALETMRTDATNVNVSTHEMGEKVEHKYYSKQSHSY